MIDLKKNRVFKSGLWYTISNFVLKGFGVITIPLFTRLLTKEEFGSYNNYTSWQSIIIIIAALNLESTLASAKFDFEDFDTYILSVLSLSTVSSAVWLLIFNIFGSQMSVFLGMEQLHINLMMVYVMLYPCISLFQSRERYFFNYKGVVVTSLIWSVSSVAVSIYAVTSFNNKLTGRIAGNVIPTVIMGLILYFYIIKKGKKIDFKMWKYALPICLPYIPHLLSLTVLNSTDRIMITQICGSKENALYSLAYSCGALVSLLLSSLNGAFAPWLGTKLNEKDYGSIHKITPLYISAFCVLAVILMLFAPEILYVLGGSRDYMEAKFVMPPVAMSCVLQFMYTLYVNVEQFKKKTAHMAAASVSAAILNLILNFWAIPKWGYIAAAYTTFASYMWLLTAHMLIVHKEGYGDVYDTKIIWKYVIIMIFQTALITWLYNTNVLRIIYIFVYFAVIIALFIKNKDKIFNSF